MSAINEENIYGLLKTDKNICRFCFQNVEEENQYFIFEENIYEVLNFCLWNKIKLNANDSLPKLICLNCYNNLHNTYNFLQLIVRSQNILNEYTEQNKSAKIYQDNFWEKTKNDKAQPRDFDNFEDISVEENSINTEDHETFMNNDIKAEKLIKKPKSNKASVTKNTLKVNILKPEKDIKKGNKKTARKSIRCCSQVFKTQTEYYAHARLHGVVRKNYECSNCHKKYVSQFELKVHLRKHTGEKPFNCSICEKSFIDKRNLKRHEKIHLETKTHECQICHRKFLHLFTLKTHERIHRGEKPYVCENCGKSFNTSTELKIHNRTHTKERPYKCTICERAFISKAALNTHSIVHTGEKKYSCTICNRKARTSYDLKTHMRCHSNERPYACKYTNCDKKYKNSSQLNVHLRTHKGEKPHKCTICLKQFGESNTLKRHLGTHEKNTERIT